MKASQKLQNPKTHNASDPSVGCSLLSAEQIIMQARCNRGRGECRINFAFPLGTEQVPVFYACSYADCGKHEHLGSFDRNHYGTAFVYAGLAPIKEAAPYMIWCTAHKEMMHFRKLKTSRSSDMCSADCLEAEGNKCRCSCGGLNHGIEAK